MVKNHFFGKKKNCDKLKKQFWVENAKIAWKLCSDTSLGTGVFFFFFFFFFLIFVNFVILAIFLKIMTKNAKKVTFWQKLTFLDFFSQNFQKYCLIQHLRKTSFSSCVLTWFSSNFSIFNSRLFVLACHKNFWSKNMVFCHFFKK